MSEIYNYAWFSLNFLPNLRAQNFVNIGEKIYKFIVQFCRFKSGIFLYATEENKGTPFEQMFLFITVAKLVLAYSYQCDQTCFNA